MGGLTDNQWMGRDVADAYQEQALDKQASVFEDTVNWPSLNRLLLKYASDAQSVLDFGCGPGQDTVSLSQLLPAAQVSGSDISQDMISLAKNSYSDSDFYVWDGREPLGHTYDCVFSKLTLQFIDDLADLARSFAYTVVDNGVLVFSVTHPWYHTHWGVGYWSQDSKVVNIGTTDVKVEMIHRSFSDWVNPFIQNGFTILEVDEPRASMGGQDDAKEEPKRLNIAMRKRPRA